jgi:hypothetical protein
MLSKGIWSQPLLITNSFISSLLWHDFCFSYLQSAVNLWQKRLVLVGPNHRVILTFGGTIVSVVKYEYHKITDSFIYSNKTPPSHAIQFSIDMQLGVVYEPVPPSEFLVLDEPTPVYTEMNWKDLNLSINDENGSHFLHYSEAHTEGYGTNTFSAHQVEFGNEYSVWFLDKAWGNANDRYDLLYKYLNEADIFTYEEKAYTAFNWNPDATDSNLIRSGQVATGTLTLIDINESTRPVLKPATGFPLDIQFINLRGGKKRAINR